MAPLKLPTKRIYTPYGGLTGLRCLVGRVELVSLRQIAKAISFFSQINVLCVKKMIY